MPDVEPVYNPELDYHWKEDEIFTMTGIQFAIFFHCHMREMNNQGGAPMANKVEAYNTMFAIYLDGIRTGKIVVQQQEAAKDLEAGKKDSDDSSVNNLFAK